MLNVEIDEITGAGTKSNFFCCAFLTVFVGIWKKLTQNTLHYPKVQIVFVSRNYSYLFLFNFYLPI